MVMRSSFREQGVVELIEGDETKERTRGEGEGLSEEGFVIEDMQPQAKKREDEAQERWKGQGRREKSRGREEGTIFENKIFLQIFTKFLFSFSLCVSIRYVRSLRIGVRAVA
jgi:hypothetical protein